MTLPFAADCMKVRTAGQIGSGEFGMIFHYHTPTIGDRADADMNTFAADISARWNTYITGLVCTDTMLTSVIVEGLNSATDGVGAWAGAIAGTLTNPTTAAACVLEKDTIARRYRGGHPRHYWPMPDKTYLTDPTHLSSGGVSLWQGGLDSYHNGVLTDAATIWTPHLTYYSNVSYYTGHALRPTPVVDHIQGWTVESLLATQRRRIGR